MPLWVVRRTSEHNHLRLVLSKTCFVCFVERLWSAEFMESRLHLQSAPFSLLLTGQRYTTLPHRALSGKDLLHAVDVGEDKTQSRKG